MIKVTAIQTGTVQIKAAQATGKPGRSALGRKIDIFRDLKWLPPLPILAFLIEHPEGLFLIDADPFEAGGEKRGVLYPA